MGDSAFSVRDDSEGDVGLLLHCRPSLHDYCH